MSTRTGQCGCGRVRITVEGEPVLVAACHCDFCQKRTGGVFGVQAYFSEDQCVEIAGDTKVYNGLEVDGINSAAGKPIDYHFCSTCGSTVYWTVEGQPGTTMVAIAVGNLVDPGFRTPMREYYTRLRHAWVLPVPFAEQFETFPEQEDRHQAF
jgi:hypothetical protein